METATTVYAQGMLDVEEKRRQLYEQLARLAGLPRDPTELVPTSAMDDAYFTAGFYFGARAVLTGLALILEGREEEAMEYVDNHYGWLQGRLFQ